MKYRGKVNGIPIYSDPNVPKNMLYMVNKKIKLSPKSVKQYEKISGFKTNGDVTMEITSDAMFDIYSDLLTKQPKRNGSIKDIDI